MHLQGVVGNPCNAFWIFEQSEFRLESAELVEAVLIHPDGDGRPLGVVAPQTAAELEQIP